MSFRMSVAAAPVQALTAGEVRINDLVVGGSINGQMPTGYVVGYTPLEFSTAKALEIFTLLDAPELPNVPVTLSGGGTVTTPLPASEHVISIPTNAVVDQINLVSVDEVKAVADPPANFTVSVACFSQTVPVVMVPSIPPVVGTAELLNESNLVECNRVGVTATGGINQQGIGAVSGPTALGSANIIAISSQTDLSSGSMKCVLHYSVPKS